MSKTMKSVDELLAETGFSDIAPVFHTGPKGKDTHTGKPQLPGPTDMLGWVADKRF